MKEGKDVPDRLLEMKDFKSIQSLYNHPFTSKEDIKHERKSHQERLFENSLKTQKDRMRKKVLSSKSMTFKIDHDGNANYNWQQLWPTQRSFRDSLVPFDVRQGVRHENRLPPMKWNNSQLNFAPNLLHLVPPTVKAHLKNLKKFGTKFPQEYKNNYRKMTEDFPIEFHTTTKSEAAPYQQSPDHENRWVTMYIQMSRLNLDEIGRMKMEIFINGRENEGKTIKRFRGDNQGQHNAPIVMRRDRTNQDYRFGDDYYNNRNDFIRLESARLPLRHQNEGYLKYLLASYYHESSRTLKFESHGELKRGKFCYQKSRAKERLDKLKEFHPFDDQTESRIGAAIEQIHNNKPTAARVRGHGGYMRNADQIGSKWGVMTCKKREGMKLYSEEMKNILLTEKQRNAADENRDLGNSRENRLELLKQSKDRHDIKDPAYWQRHGYSGWPMFHYNEQNWDSKKNKLRPEGEIPLRKGYEPWKNTIRLKKERRARVPHKSND